MSSTIITSRSVQPNVAVLARVADRWRPAGLFFACIDREGNLLWHDSQMPRLLSLCFTADNSISQQIIKLRDTAAPGRVRVDSPLPGMQVQLIPVTRRRKLSAWLAILAHTDAIPSASEEVARFAQKVGIDALSIPILAKKIPMVALSLFSSLVAIAEHMHDDLQNAATVEHELANVTEQLTSVYEEISLLYKISSGMRFSQKPQAFLESVCREVQESGNYLSVAVALANHEDDSATPVLGDIDVLVGQCPIAGKDLLAAMHEPIYDALAGGETQVHNEIPPDCDWAHLRTAAKRFVCVPLKRDQRSLGVMIALDKNDSTEFNSVDLKLLNNVGSQCSIFLENAALYQDMQGLFMGILHALTRSIDAKDAYTRGHSQRVAELSRALAVKIGLPEEQCERIYLSGLLHDVGKIGVPEAVLTKPGRLTDAEFDAIKKHPEIGAQILGNIKQLQDILPGVLYHHERWDGTGYPHQFAGEQIPLMGRIICVADCFDAMSSTRTYRPALPLETVLAEIQRCGGAQFDPALANVFVTLDFTPYRQSIEEQNAATQNPRAPLAEPPALPQMSLLPPPPSGESA
jgi:HD-GYP domain-containing protein (c-di-GMP phosphodiesterase class II)